MPPRKKKTETTPATDALATTRAAWLTQLTELCADSVRDMGDVGVIRERARIAARDLEVARAAAKKPHLDAGRAVDAAYKAVTDVLDQVVARCGDIILEAQRAQQAAVQALVSDSTTPAEQKHEQLKEVLTAAVVPGGVRLVQEYSYELVDFEQVPREYLMLDDRRIRATLKATCGTQEIPGLRVVRTTAVRTR